MNNLNDLQNEIETLKAQLEVERLKAELKEVQADQVTKKPENKEEVFSDLAAEAQRKLEAHRKANGQSFPSQPDYSSMSNFVRDEDRHLHNLNWMNHVPYPTDECWNNPFFFVTSDGKVYRSDKRETTMWKYDQKPGWAKALGL